MEQEFGDVPFNLPNTIYLQRIANRARSALRPKEPETKDFQINTDFLDASFIIGDIRVGNERHILFATQDQLQLLKRAKRWFLDGTFKIVCKPFMQLFGIHAFVSSCGNRKQIPLVFVLMTRRRRDDFVSVFEKLMEIVGPVDVEGFMMDFESGLWAAVRDIFPGTNFKGCVFHWCQAVFRKVANLGLRTTYEKREGVHWFIARLLSLPFFQQNISNKHS